MLHNTVYH